MTPRSHLSAAAVLAFLLAPHRAPAQAQTQAPEKQEKPACPWLTAGTAAATLGAPATATVTLHGDPDRPEGTCRFTTPQGSVLEIAVIAVTSAPPEPACPADSPKLPGIGNEATACYADRRFVLTSRVRDLFFRTILSLQPTTPQPDPRQQEAHQQQLERIAEQVAGNLF